MTIHELRDLLREIADTHEFVIADPLPADAVQEESELFAIWSAARAEANEAYEAWGRTPGRDSYSVFLAAEDRADAAEAALAESRVPQAARHASEETSGRR